MKRWIYVPLVFCLVGALTFVLCRRPAEGVPAAEAGASAEDLPEDTALRMLARRRIAREAAEGRRSLAEAAALFGALNRRAPAPGAERPGGAEAVRLCRRVIAYLDFALADRPREEVRAAAARLEAELRDGLRRDGDIRLPDPASLTPVHEILEQVRQATTAAERQALFGPRRQAPGVE